MKYDNPIFPSNKREDYWIGAFLDLVMMRPGLQSGRYLDALNLMTRPELCLPFLRSDLRSRFASLASRGAVALIKRRSNEMLCWMPITQLATLTRAVVEVSGTYIVGSAYESVRGHYLRLPVGFVRVVVDVEGKMRAVIDTATSANK